MSRSSKWNPKVIKQFEEVSELKFAKTLAELGELIYKEIRSRQLLSQIDPSIATRSEESHRNSERKVANA
jgi:hypothetical protein